MSRLGLSVLYLNYVPKKLWLRLTPKHALSLSVLPLRYLLHSFYTVTKGRAASENEQLFLVFLITT